jgi:hypothetical protein
MKQTFTNGDKPIHGWRYFIKTVNGALYIGEYWTDTFYVDGREYKSHEIEYFCEVSALDKHLNRYDKLENLKDL